MTKREDNALVAAVGVGLSAAAATADDNVEGVPGFQYAPTDDMRALKSRFWHRFKQNPLIDEEDVTPALVEQLTGRSVQGFTNHPGFWPWFSNTKVTEILIEMAAERAAQTALGMLDPSFPLNDNARVQLIKYVLEFSGRSTQQRSIEKWMDKDVANADEKMLDEMIERHLARKQRQTP
jgi:hypothetical protein